MATNGNGNALNVSVLGAAKEMYIKQLKIVLTPLIHEGFVSLWEDAQKKEDDQGGYNYLKQFQIFLKDIPNWNQTILEEETRRILGKIGFLMELVTAVFVSHVKILASVRLSGNNRNIRIKVPSSDVFIHTVYTNAAEMIYYNPFIFQSHTDRESYEKIRDLIEKSIDETINSMIPIESVLKEYLSNVFSGHIKASPVPDLPPDEPTGHLLSGSDMGLPISEESPDNPLFGTGDDPFANPFPSSNIGGDSSDIINDTDDTNDMFGIDSGSGIGGGIGIESGSGDGIGSDPFGSTDPFEGDGSDNSTDLFGGSSDPFGGSSGGSSGGSADPGESPVDPFGGSSGGSSGGSADPGESPVDPFGGSSGGSADPGESPADPFDSSEEKKESSDPFGSEEPSDPFGSEEKKESSDPFSSSGESDPFGSSSSGESDPFGSSSSGESDPFGSGESSADPFGVGDSSSADPFASSSGGADPFASSSGDADPFASGAPDPFSSNPDDIKTMGF